jgi:ribosomal protein S18 acetylase RimI-like enzyme
MTALGRRRLIHTGIGTSRVRNASRSIAPSAQRTAVTAIDRGAHLHPPGWTEISAVCTDPAHRGRGLATRLVRAVAAGIRRRGETPFLHTAASNSTAIRLYESIGFELRRQTTFGFYRSPG